MSIPAFPGVPVLLVDGDIIAYRAAAVAEKTYYAVEDFTGNKLFKFDSAKEAKEFAPNLPRWSRKEIQPESFALECLQSSMDAIAKRFPGGIIQVYISGERNFRDTIWRTKKYKGNRTVERPKHLEALRQALISRWFAVVSQNQEADDDIGVQSGGDTVVCSTDKDLDQIPGWHYNFTKDELYWITPEDAEAYFWEQVISGDQVDNIPGLPGWGPVKARKYMEDAKNWDISTDMCVFDLFAKEGFDQAYFEEMCGLIRIRRQ